MSQGLYRSQDGSLSLAKNCALGVASFSVVMKDVTRNQAEGDHHASADSIIILKLIYILITLRARWILRLIILAP